MQTLLLSRDGRDLEHVSAISIQLTLASGARRTWGKPSLSGFECGLAPNILTQQNPDAGET